VKHAQVRRMQQADIPVGARVGAILSADDHKVYLFGYGTYQGKELPPVPYGIHAQVFGAETWEEYDAALKREINHIREQHQGETGVPPEDWMPPRPVNPKILLDNGEVVWGYESWWGPEEEITRLIGNRHVVMVDIAQYRAGML
jgi:hypothetical protein